MNLPDRVQNRGPLVASYRQQITQKHEEGKQADDTLRDALLSKLRITHQTGTLLSSAKKSLGKTEFASATDFLGEEAISTCWS